MAATKNHHRPIADGEIVEVYWNLHRDCFSVRAARGEDRGRVIAHVASFALTDVQFAVGEAGRLRCIAEGKKNVHAFARGRWSADERPQRVARVTYNPYRDEYFVSVRDGSWVLGALRAFGWTDGDRPRMGTSI